MSDLKKQTISGLTWSFIDNIAVYSVEFIVGIILARLLTPKEFGLIGMITIFIIISNSFVDSGFTQAIIRKRNSTQIDYSTIFIFNTAVSIVFYLILFFLSPTISNFFNEPQLSALIKVLGLILIVDSLAIVQRARLIKRIDFKLQTKISLIASISSGVVGVYLAYKGFGVWSLVAKMLLQKTLVTLFLWIWNKWKPALEFSIESFKEMFSFGYKLLISGLINTVYKNLYYLIIGKFFSATELGYYTRADQFKRLPSENITYIIQRVSYPVLSTIQNNVPKLRESYRRLIKSTMFITFFLMLTLAAIAKPMIQILIGEKWLPSVIYLQLLCFVGVFYPLHAINLNMLTVQGRSDLFLKLEIIKKILAVPAIIIGVLIGIKAMIIALIINSAIAYILNSHYSGKYIGYSSFDQLRDILPSFFFAISISFIVFITGLIINTNHHITLLVQIIIAITMLFIGGELLNFKEYIYLKHIVCSKFFNRNEKSI